MQQIEWPMANFFLFAGRRKTRGNKSMKTLATLLRISLLAVLVTVLFWAYATMAQTETGTISGLITDESGAAVPGAQVQLLNVQRGTTSDAKTNNAGIYVFSAVEPGRYQIKVQKPGFKQVDLLSLIVNVQDHIEQNVRLQIGSVSESVTVNANDIHINTTDATVSTVVDRQFAENLPLNGRSFQSLILLSPGVVATAVGPGDAGQFSVNGQRASANYWMVDGVSANVAANPGGFGGQQEGGAIGTTNIFGGTAGLVSVDAMQEFRIQTSTFAPEYGRTPGAQISIVTRSGSNGFHGLLFDYLRNDIFDANNWFNGINLFNTKPLPKARERQNDFGGTFSGPIVPNRTFFFFSYEGLRLRLPNTALTDVPCDSSCSVFGDARTAAVAAMQPYLNAFPTPNGPEELNSTGQATGFAHFNSSYSDPGTADAYSIRVDHKISDRLSLFGRYNNSPSELQNRGNSGNTNLATIAEQKNTAQQVTSGLTSSLTPVLVDEFRFNYSKTDVSSRFFGDNFGGARPLSSVSLPTPFNLQNSLLNLSLGLGVTGPSGLTAGTAGSSSQHQINVVDTVSWQKGGHSLRFGIDYRRLTPDDSPPAYQQAVSFADITSSESGAIDFLFKASRVGGTLLFRNLSMFAQDTWHVVAPLTVTYGLRWDADFVPQAFSGNIPAADASFDLSNFSTLTLAPAGTSAYRTSLHNFAPRVGGAYQVSSRPNWNLVARMGVGLFYDLTTAEAGALRLQGGYPFENFGFSFQPSDTFPLNPNSPTAAPPPIAPPSPSTPGTLAVFDPHFKTPYTVQWNVSLEQALGGEQSLTASYVGAIGRRLIQTTSLTAPNPSFTTLDVFTNGATSDYHSMQLQFRRRLTHGLQAIASYTWSHAIDSGSTGNIVVGSNAAANLANSANRASSDFDIRHSLSAAMSYDVPNVNGNRMVGELLRGWSLENIFQVRTAEPVQLTDGNVSHLSNGFTPDIWPDVVPGTPFYLYGPQYPGGKAFNRNIIKGACPDGSDQVGAWCSPPLDANGNALRQGSAGRNALRAFGFYQWDFAVHREFRIRETAKIQFRAEMFNVLNHPTFGPPVGNIAFKSQFGLSTQTFGQFLSGVPGSGGLNSRYQIGGPRSMQLALRVSF
jgi:hypothetical protein